MVAIDDKSTGVEVKIIDVGTDVVKFEIFDVVTGTNAKGLSSDVVNSNIDVVVSDAVVGMTDEVAEKTAEVVVAETGRTQLQTGRTFAVSIHVALKTDLALQVSVAFLTPPDCLKVSSETYAGVVFIINPFIDGSTR